MMEMSNEEIKRSFRTAKYPASQIKILAELNGVTQREIREVLGDELKKNPEKSKKAKPGTRSDYVQTVVIARMEEIETAITSYENEYTELADFLKTY